MAQNEEREMTIHQRGLVDTCFEEGKYDSAIASLDQLRSPSFRPHADHIRQLLYMALFPPPPPTGDQTSQLEQTPPSPNKHKHVPSKISLSPSISHSTAAQRVLFSFLATNSPGSLFRALPRYPLDDPASNELLHGLSDNGHDGDSVISQASLCIKDCKDCWAILKDGFIQRKMLLPKESSKKRGRTTHNVEDAVLDQSQVRSTQAVVAEHAWPVLQWLLSLFEKDELSNSSSQEKFSPLLLSQIPPPRGGTGPRWEAGAPLDIVFYAVNQDDDERRDMATGLLTLLINLTFSGSFDGPQFAATLTTRLYTSSQQIVQNLMESLPKTIPVLTFKITVCQRFLSSSSTTNGDGSTKPRPRPLLRRGTRRDSALVSSAADVDAGRVASSRPALVASPEVFQLLCNEYKPQTSASEPPALAMKYVFLVSYAHLQGLLLPEQRDGGWKAALSNGKLKQVIDSAFPGNSTYHKTLTIITKFWPVT